ncbi:MAG: class I SAM-dependent methyltransferase [Bacillota bacterium]|nr:class I SAM-dependent methyltransferase [Bacillota bacterium]HOB91613.1 class I SAM-dependent methyltransferase [Bacillota bacterium]HPZ54469.1 class I SAM-dependent methyltransferase [Bacillota bacterium]HQD17805.1 class I SAM-dependent methyltransferase [Bacillota bacterium]
MFSEREVDHYYSERPLVKENFRTTSLLVGEIPLTFVTSSGVFSKSRVDRGTALLVRCIEVYDGEQVLDLGCGYGAVGIAAARMAPGCTVTMVDINSRAVELARRNAELNRVDNVEVVHGNGFDAVKGRRFHRILTNPPYRAGKKLVYTWLEQSLDHLYPGGALYVVGQRKQGILSLRDRLAEIFGSVDTLAIEGGYRVLRSRKATVQSP